MDKETALNILIANVYCTDESLHCTDCPLYEEGKTMEWCSGFDDDELLEAVKVLKK